MRVTLLFLALGVAGSLLLSPRISHSTHGGEASASPDVFDVHFTPLITTQVKRLPDGTWRVAPDSSLMNVTVSVAPKFSWRFQKRIARLGEYPMSPTAFFECELKGEQVGLREYYEFTVARILLDQLAFSYQVIPNFTGNDITYRVRLHEAFEEIYGMPN